MPQDRHETQPSAEIVRVVSDARNRECDLSRSRATLCGDRACRAREMQARLRFVPVAGNPLRRSRVSSARNAGESAICLCPSQPSAEIARVECAKRRRDCDLVLSGATLCGDCASSARNAGETAICPGRAQPSAAIVRVERAKCRRECDLSLSRAALCADRACRAHEMQARVRFVPVAGNPLRGLCVENWRLCSITLVRGVSGELEDENWRLCSTTLVRGAI